MIKIIFLVLLSTLIISSPSNASYVFVGNGGEGYESEGVLYARDLYDYQIHKSPYFREFNDPNLKDTISSLSHILSPADQNLLNQKITEINSAIPALGDSLLLAMLYFEWQYTESPLGLINPDETRIIVDPTKRVAIANRYLRSILIDKAAFNRLDSQNKVALILHEAVFALSRVQRLDNYGKQSLSVTRQLTAGLFTRSTLKSSDFQDLVRKSLSIDYAISSSPSFEISAFDKSSIKISFNNGRNNVRDLWLSINDLRDPQALSKGLCAGFYKSENFAGTIEVGPILPRSIGTIPYKASPGIEQLALFSRTPKNLTALVYSQDPKICEQKLTESLRDLIRGRKDR